MDAIPPEIVTEFVTYFNHESNENVRRANLCSCSLVSRTWRSVAQPLLFSRVILRLAPFIFRTPSARTLPGQLKIRSFVDVISQSPHLSQHTGALWIEEPVSTALPILESIATAIPTLKQIRIFDGIYSETRHLLPCLKSLLNSEHLTGLSLLSVEISLEIFSNCPGLRELELRDSKLFQTEVTQASNMAPVVSRARPRLDSLSISATSLERILPSLTVPEDVLDLSRLRILALYDSNRLPIPYAMFYSQFVDKVSPSLECINLRPPTTYPRYLLLPPFPKMKNLRCLSASLRDAHGNSPSDSFPWIVDLLSNLPHPEKLEEVYLHGTFRLEFKRAEFNPQDENRRQRWTQLDTIMTSPIFVRVRTVSICFYDDLSQEDKRDNLISRISGCLPGLFSQGRLSFEFCFPIYGGVHNDYRHWGILQSGPWKHGVTYY
ncbi:hypothetical protein BDN72DRAFT_838647 [Pluteus cervinus]|uniref:Uncharacterized protein n=1 Tax=Pluteus cervinus TaxID=181527 RepID=A0ACD3AY91_9AGAR|nr:hypothetical protein BDN72DRAFT_838647 [Pluteus cervinus]